MIPRTPKLPAIPQLPWMQKRGAARTPNVSHRRLFCKFAPPTQFHPQIRIEAAVLQAPAPAYRITFSK